MSKIEAAYTDARAWFEAELELERDPKTREALGVAIATCNKRIAQERARLRTLQGVPA